MYENVGMNMLMSVLFSIIAVLFPMQGEVLFNRVDVYDAPNSSANVIGNYTHGDIVEVLGQDATGNFYEITHDGGTGWVLANYVWQIDDSLGKITNFPDFNASVKYDTFAYNLDSGNYEITTIAISKDSRVKILSGYDNKKDYTEVQVVTEGNLRVYYLLTEAIAPDGVNPMVIVAISLVATAIGIVFIVMGVRFTKKRRKESLK